MEYWTRLLQLNGFPDDSNRNTIVCSFLVDNEISCVSHLENAELSDLRGTIGSGQYSIPLHVMHRAGAGRLRAAERKFLSELRLNKRRKIDW